VNFDLSNAITVAAMFRNAESFTRDISTFYTPKVVDFSFFLAGATSFNGDLPFDTTSATDMNNMFNGATSFNGNIANFQTGSVIYEAALLCPMHFTLPIRSMATFLGM
jgi:hypothetical protein